MTLQRILYVEDESDIREVARIALEIVGGFETLACSSGQEALEKGPAFVPDLILMDVMMPGMDGPSTLQKMRKNKDLSEVPVCFMTAKVQPDEVASYKAMGVLDVISKPFDPMSLGDEVRRIWGRARG